jgi:hypothetical protein
MSLSKSTQSKQLPKRRKFAQSDHPASELMPDERFLKYMPRKKQKNFRWRQASENLFPDHLCWEVIKKSTASFRSLETIRVNRWVFENIAQNVAGPFFVKVINNFNRVKKWTNFRLLMQYFKYCPNTRPIGENSPNLITLETIWNEMFCIFALLWDQGWR